MTTFKVLAHDLTPKQQKFVANILKNVAAGNEEYTQTQAAKDIGGTTDGSASVAASNWMKNEKVVLAIYKGLVSGARAKVEEAKWPGVKKLTEEWIINCLGLISAHPKTAANNRIASLKLIGSWRKLNMWRETQVVEDIDAAKSEQQLLGDIDELENELQESPQSAAPKEEKAPSEAAGLPGEKPGPRYL